MAIIISVIALLEYMYSSESNIRLTVLKGTCMDLEQSVVYNSCEVKQHSTLELAGRRIRHEDDVYLTFHTVFYGMCTGTK